MSDVFFFRGAGFWREEVLPDGTWRVIFGQLPMLFDPKSWTFIGRDESPLAQVWLEELCQYNLGGNREWLARHLASTWDGKPCP